MRTEEIKAEDLTQEQRHWMAHRNVLSPVPFAEAGYRGCIGLALLITDTGSGCLFVDGERKLVHNDAIRWASVVDIPPGRFETKVRRYVHWATIRPTTIKFGTPTISRGTEQVSFDLCFPPVIKTPENEIFYRDSLDANDVQTCRLFNAIEMAMTSAAFAARATWRPHRQKFNQLVAQMYDIDVGDNEAPLLYGDAVYGDIPHVSLWMPKPYIAFLTEQADAVFYEATSQSWVNAIGYSLQLRMAFIDAMAEGLEYKAKYSGTVAAIRRELWRNIPSIAVELQGDRGEFEIVRFHADTCTLCLRRGARFKIGDVIGEERMQAELPDDWFSRELRECWEFAMRTAFPQRLDDVMSLWFRRTAVQLIDGYTHFPAPIANVAAMGSAEGSQLLWDITQPLHYFREDIDACILPPIPIRNWHQFTGTIHDMPYDFQPVDRRYVFDEFRRAGV